jgi:hypothetical protein
MTAPSVGEVMTLISPPVGAVLAALDEMPRTPDWLTKHLDADPRRMGRLAIELGLVEGERGWFGKLRLWRLTEKGSTWHRIWRDEIARRQAVTAKGPSWLEGEEPQEGDTVRTFESGVAGMVGASRAVPHNARAVHHEIVPPGDMVSALGLLEEGEGVSIQYLVGANTAGEGTTVDRMEAILAHLEGDGLVVRGGHGWVRTPMGTRWHQTWSGAEGSAT